MKESVALGDVVSSRFEALTSVTLAISALVVAGVFTYQQVLRPSKHAGARTEPPVFLREWRELTESGISVGPDTASVQIVELVDFECPACKTFHATLANLANILPGKVSVVYVHFPLPTHRFAEAAARAAECAHAQGSFAEMAAALFAKQDSFGLRQWTSYAHDAHVADTLRFARCMTHTKSHPRIDAGRALGARIKARGTPTVIVNGWRFHSPPSEEQLTRFALAVIAGEEPFQ